MQPNKSKQIASVCYIVLISVVCTVPLVGTFFHWGSQSTENRTMMTLPKLWEADEDSVKLNTEYTAKLGDYYSEHFGFRQELVTANAALNEAVFGRSANSKTTVGRDGWYFFNESMDDYTGAAALSERGIYRLKKTLDLMNQYAERGNITMAFFAAPNKNSIYPEFMPWHIRQSRAPSNLDRLTEAMADSDYYIDMKQELLALKEEESHDIYLKHDSHWNNLGALAAYNAMQNNLNRRIDKFDYMPVRVDDDDLTQTQITGDLTNTLYPSVQKTGVQYDLGIEKNFSSDRPLSDLMAEISTTCQGRYYTEICYRDSFFNALIAINSNSFAKVRYTRVFPYDMTAARSGGYNIAVVEIVERNLPKLLDNAPTMDAVSVERPQISNYNGGEQHCQLVDNGEALQLNGTLGDWANLQEDSNIYIELRDSNNKSHCYEAFPICEGDGYNDNGFSITISKYSLMNGEYKAYIHVGNAEKASYTELLFNA